MAAGEGRAAGKEVEEEFVEGKIGPPPLVIDLAGLAGLLDVAEELAEALLVTLAVAGGEPEAAVLLGFDIEQFDLALHVRLFLPWVEDLNEMHLAGPRRGVTDRLAGFIDVAP